MCSRSLLLILLWLGLVSTTEAASDHWQPLQAGLEIGYFSLTKNHPEGEADLVILRADPAAWELVSFSRNDDPESRSMTTRQWAETHQLTAAINAGMYAQDGITHVGFLQAQGQVIHADVNHYQSVAAFGPRQPAEPEFRIFDLDDPQISMDWIRRNYDTVIQNLRLIKRPGINRWRHNKRQWSEAALGEDAAGRMLLIHSRTPMTMYRLNEKLLQLGIDLVAAQHLEGGAEAQLFVHASAGELERAGIYHSGFLQNPSSVRQSPVPNVIGIRARKKD